MPMFLWDPTMILLIPAIILAIWAQMRVSSTYNKYSKVSSAQGITGEKAARYLLQRNGISDVEIEQVEGKLSDHYDPRVKKVRLSQNNYQGKSLRFCRLQTWDHGPHFHYFLSGFSLTRLC